MNCPFCNSSETILLRVDNGTAFAVSCDTCGARGPVSQGPDEALESWNDRIDLDKFEALFNDMADLFQSFRI